MIKHSRQGESSTPFQAFPWMSGLNGAGFDAVTRAAAACNKACAEWQREIVRFTTARLQRDGEFGRQLLATRELADIAKLQRDWFAEAGQDYADEASRLARLAQDLGADLMRAASSEAPQETPEAHHPRGTHGAAE